MAEKIKLPFKIQDSTLPTTPSTKKRQSEVLHVPKVRTPSRNLSLVVAIVLTIVFTVLTIVVANIVLSHRAQDSSEESQANETEYEYREPEKLDAAGREHYRELVGRLKIPDQDVLDKVATGLPAVDMHEIYAEKSSVGEAHEITTDGTMTYYDWYAPDGTWVFEICCIHQRVAAVDRINELEYWNPDGTPNWDNPKIQEPDYITPEAEAAQYNPEPELIVSDDGKTFTVEQTITLFPEDTSQVRRNTAYYDSPEAYWNDMENTLYWDFAMKHPHMDEITLYKAAKSQAYMDWYRYHPR